MKTIAVLSFLLLFAGARSDEQALRALETEWDDALLRRDAKTLERILDDDFLFIAANGSATTKKELIAYVQKPDETEMKKNRTEDVTVRVWKDTAVLTGRYVEEGLYRGRPYEIRTRYTDVYVKRDGAWVAVSAHASDRKVIIDGKPQ